MVKLLRFKSDGNSNTDIYGYGKQPIVVGQYSSIALKNYNIQLAPDPDNSTFAITPGNNVLGYGLTGLEEPTTLSVGSYTVDQLVREINTKCNIIPGQNPAGSCSVTTQVTHTLGKLKFTTLQCLAAGTFDLSDANYLEVQNEQPGAVILGVGSYDATNADQESYSVLQSGGATPLTCPAFTCAETFAADIVAVGDRFEFFLQDANAVTLYGIAYDAAEYSFFNGNIEYAIRGIVPTVGDTFRFDRSGLAITITIVQAGGTTVYTSILDPAIMNELLYVGQTAYIISTVGVVSLANITLAFPSSSNACQVDLNPQTDTLARLLGLAAAGTQTSILADPTVLSPPNELLGSLNYSGIMVCVNGLDLESYDFASNAEGKVNFLYTIQNVNQWIDVAGGTYTGSNAAAGDISNEPFIGMGNQSASNINNKLSLYLLDTASGRKLKFTYADLLVLIHERAE